MNLRISNSTLLLLELILMISMLMPSRTLATNLVRVMNNNRIGHGLKLASCHDFLELMTTIFWLLLLFNTSTQVPSRRWWHLLYKTCLRMDMVFHLRQSKSIRLWYCFHGLPKFSMGLSLTHSQYLAPERRAMLYWWALYSVCAAYVLLLLILTQQYQLWSSAR